MVITLFRWLNVILLLLTLLSYVSPYVNPYHFWPISLLGLAYPWLLLLNLLFVAGWTILRRRYALMSLFAILAGIGHLTSFIGFHPGSEPAQPESIHVMSYNIYGFRGLPKGPDGRNHDEAQLWAFFRTAGAVDLLCLQESLDHHTQRISEQLTLPHTHQFPGRGTAIVSRYPLLNTGEIRFADTNNSCVWADVALPAGRIRVYSLHLQSNFISHDASKLAREGDLQERETWRGIRGIIGKYRRFALLRIEQATRVASHIKGSPYPVILGGDFNDTPLSRPYRILSDGLYDAFQQQGSGLGTTYAGSIPGLRIDYLLVDPRLQILDYQVYREPISDHYPVSSHLLPKSE